MLSKSPAERVYIHKDQHVVSWYVNYNLCILCIKLFFINRCGLKIYALYLKAFHFPSKVSLIIGACIKQLQDICTWLFVDFYVA